MAQITGNGKIFPQYFSPLRYPGGKGKLYDYIKIIIKDNNLKGGYYVEPYAGGASLALKLLQNNLVSKILINDIDRSIYAFWYSVINQTEELCHLIEKTNINIDNWEKQKEIQNQKERYALLELGFSTFYLNRTNRSGIIKGGVIGGKKQDGTWKIDARYNKDNLVDRIKTIANLKDDIELYNMDACDFICMADKICPSNALFYLDPPYYIKGKELYVNHYNKEDHIEVEQCIEKIKNRYWMVSYDYTKPIIRLYDKYCKKSYSLNYSAASIRKKGREVIFFSHSLHAPVVKNPLKIAKSKKMMEQTYFENVAGF